MRRARLLASCGSALLLMLAGSTGIARAQAGTATASIEVRRAGASAAWGETAAAEQEPGLEATFFLRITNIGDAVGSFAVRGDHGGAAFALRYLEGGEGDRRITGAVEDGTYALEGVRPGGVRILRLRVKVEGSAPIDRTGDWAVEVMPLEGADAVVAVDAEVRTVAWAFARAGGVTLRIPAKEATITFHESLFEQAAALRPIGTLLRNDSSAFDPPPGAVGPGYIVMESRERGTPATSGSDDVIGTGEPVLAPVSGTVIRVTAYELYCEWPDVRVAIRPDVAPERTVQIFHLVDPGVRRGDHVVVSHTLLGTARLFPFRSQTQDYGLGARHVHLEIELDGSAPLPGCSGRAVSSPRV